MSIVEKFLGLPRWRALWQALALESSKVRQPELGITAVLIALLLGLCPPVLTFIDSLTPETVSAVPTIAFGVCAVLALVFRLLFKLRSAQTSDWKHSLNLTHTAVALGCIPAVCIVVFYPHLLAERRDLLTEVLIPGPPEQQIDIAIMSVISVVVFSAAWVAVTEELIFRGLLFSVLRRWRFLSQQKQRDTLAATLSAVIFGLAHYATWGPVAAVALTGLGLGFVLAYLANGERLLPVILYHFVFDLLSISVSLFL